MMPALRDISSAGWGDFSGTPLRVMAERVRDMHQWPFIFSSSL